MVSRTLVLPAAGAGTRFGGSVPKSLSLVEGSPMITRVIAAVQRDIRDIGVVIVTQSDHEQLFRSRLRETARSLEIVVDDTLGGSAGAVHCALSSVATEEIIIAWPDHVGIEFLPLGLFREQIPMGHAGFMPVVERSNPYAAVDVSDRGDVINFVSPETVRSRRMVQALSDCGSFVLNASSCRRFIENDVGRGSRDHNLVSVLGRQRGTDAIAAFVVGDWRSSLGVNSHGDLEVFHRARQLGGERSD